MKHELIGQAPRLLKSFFYDLQLFDCYGDMVIKSNSIQLGMLINYLLGLLIIFKPPKNQQGCILTLREKEPLFQYKRTFNLSFHIHK